MPKKKITKSKKSKPEIDTTPEMYRAWIEQFANTITDTLMAEIVRIKSAGKKKKIDI